MSTSLRIIAVSALLVTGIISVASAAPLGELSAIAKVFTGVTQTVQWRGGPGPVVGGLIAGAIVGGTIAASAAPYGPGYYGPPPVAYGPPPGDAVAYCMQQYRSYDPRSGTSLGYGGFRHPCP